MTRASRQSVQRVLSTAVGALVLVALAGCGGAEIEPEADADPSTQASGPTEDASATASASATSATPAGDPAPADDKPFGPGCGRFKTDGGVGPGEFRNAMELGAFSVIFNDLIGDGAALMNRSDLFLKTDTTYFLPTNDAIEVLNQDQQGDLIFDDDTRLQIMGRHIVDGSLPPSALAGEHPTVNDSTLQVAVDGDDVRVGLQRARVLCGNIELEQGVRVYVIDQVLIT